MFRGLLRSSKPVVLMTTLVAVLGISGTAYGAKLITGLDIRDGSITTVDLSKNTQAAFHGDKGDKGNKGNDGAPGAQGITGAIGLTGARGVTGDTGAGVQGAQGSVGLTGAIGPLGLTGLQGDAGADSTVAGPQGDTGATGSAGLQGIAGNQGNQGPIGLAGSQGAIGVTGTTGASGADSTVAGPQGNPGVTGAIGATGAQGIQGDTGATGATGLQGDPGTPGVNAVSGIAYYYNVTPQTVEADGDVVFDTNGFATTNGFTHAENSSPVTVFTNGIYKVSFSVSSAEVSVLGVYVNNVAVPGSTYQSNAINQQNTGQVVTAVSADSLITIKSTSAITLPGLSPAVNASITVERVG